MWEIFAYQNADSLFGIFNAAAAIHSSNDYHAAVAAVAFFGFVAALLAYAFAPDRLQGWKWLATVVLVFAVLIVPRVFEPEFCRQLIDYHERGDAIDSGFMRNDGSGKTVLVVDHAHKRRRDCAVEDMALQKAINARVASGSGRAASSRARKR